MRDDLAFPAWVMGQVLLPEQFLALQQTILAHIDRRAELGGLPSHGLARLRWSEELLATGAISIDGLTWVFESGLLLDVPGNTVIGNLNLADAKSDAVSLFLHVRNQTCDASDMPQYADDDPSVTRVIHQAELSLEDKHDDTRESGKLAELVRGADGWALGRFSPPLLSVGRGSLPFLRETLESSQRAVERIERHLAGRSIDAFLGADQLSELRRVRASAYRVLALLGDHGLGDDRQEVALHPYHLFAALRDFYVEISILQGAPPEPWPVRYRHTALATSFEDLRVRIDRYTGESRLVAPRLEFERKADWFVTGTFPEDLCRAVKVYLVIKPGQRGKVSLDGVKLASPHRIEEVYTRALAGVRLVPLESASLSHTYGGDSSLYQVVTQGDMEWSKAVDERALCFRAWPELEGVRAALVWGG
jgi:type VI secretion system protein ImpJ